MAWLLIIAVIIGFLRGGRFGTMPPFRRAWILAPALALQLASILFRDLSPVLASLSYAFIIAFLALNWAFEELRLVLIGTSLNAIAIWTNGGQMPVLNTGAVSKDVSQLRHGIDWHGLLTSHTHFPILADIMYIPYPLPTAFSFGDIFIYVGAGILVQRLMNKPINLSALSKGVKKS